MIKFSDHAIHYRVPGRINLIGEHTDYNDGYVFPGAINLGLNFTIDLSEDDFHHFYSGHFDAYDLIDFKGQTHQQPWSRYFQQVLRLFYQRDLIFSPIKCRFEGNLPIGAGVSSSSALACGLIWGINELFQLGLTNMDMVRLASIAENGTGLQGGLMDQFSIIHGVRNSLLLLDCRDMSYEVVPVEFGDYQIVLFDSRVEHKLVDTEYNDRRKDCENGLAALQTRIPSLTSVSDIEESMLSDHSDVLTAIERKRLSFVIAENGRTLYAKKCLVSNDLKRLGDLLYESHKGLSEEYEVSCQELDFIVAYAKTKNEILGARMMGGGFGGCVICLINKFAVEEVYLELSARYRAVFNHDPHYHLITLSDGIHKV